MKQDHAVSSGAYAGRQIRKTDSGPLRISNAVNRKHKQIKVSRLAKLPGMVYRATLTGGFSQEHLGNVLF